MRKNLYKSSVLALLLLVSCLLGSGAETGYISQVTFDTNHKVIIQVKVEVDGVVETQTATIDIKLYKANLHQNRYRSCGFNTYSVHPLKGTSLLAAMNDCHGDDDLLELQYRRGSNRRFLIPWWWLPEWAQGLPPELRTVTFPITAYHIDFVENQLFRCKSSISGDCPARFN